MDFSTLINERHSIRKFKPKPVAERDIITILNAARRAPSAGNLQSYEVIIIKDQARKEALSIAAHDQPCISQAPVVLAFLADTVKSSIKYHDRGKKLYSIQDATIACSYAQLMVTNLGLSSVWIGSFDELSMSNILKVDKRYKLIALLPIGYPDEKPFITSRRELGEFVHNETF